MTAGLLL